MPFLKGCEFSSDSPSGELINEIYDMGSLMKLTIIDLLGFKNLGIKGVTAINKELYEYGLFLNEGTI